MDVFGAAQTGDLGRVRALVEQDAGLVHATSGNEWTPLLWAADRAHVEVARYLLDHGATINHRDEGGWTALHWACQSNDTRTVLLLLQRGADVTVRGGLSSRHTPLILTADDGHEAVVRVLLEHGGSDVDAADDDGWTACHWAAYRAHAGVLRQLLEAGADPTLRNAHGNTAIDCAAQSEAQESEELVIEEQECFIILREWDRAYQLQRVRHLRYASSSTPQQGS